LLWFKSKFDKGWTHTFPAYQHRPTDVLIDGTVKFKDIGIELDGVIVETPGHSDDSISLVLDDGRCFCGDAAANFLRFAGTRYAVVWVDSWEEYYNSWEKLIALKVNRIYPAHGKDFHVNKLVTNLRKNRKKNMVVITQG
jgi:glyoxylase-like metal-dependent hydrolase (beta-lactamase superfamily II)